MSQFFVFSKIRSHIISLFLTIENSHLDFFWRSYLFGNLIKGLSWFINFIKPSPFLYFLTHIFNTSFFNSFLLFVWFFLIFLYSFFIWSCVINHKIFSFFRKKCILFLIIYDLKIFYWRILCLVELFLLYIHDIWILMW